jgi:hypothetical protein
MKRFDFLPECSIFRRTSPKLHMNFHRSFLAIALGAPFMHAAYASTLPVFEDTFAPLNGALTKTAGKATSLSVAPTRASFIRFDFELGFDPLLATEVTRAQLIFYVSKVVKAGDLTLHRIKEDWTEAVQRNTPAPSIDEIPFAMVRAEAVVAKQFIIVDVTTQVKEWFADPSSAFGFALLSGGVANVSLGSKEGPGAGYPATLGLERIYGLSNEQLSAGIDSAKLGIGNVDNVELSFLNGVSGAIQTQFDGLIGAVAGNNTALESLGAQVRSLSTGLDTVFGTVNAKVSKAGDTMNGALSLPINGLSVGTNQLVATEGKVGISTANPKAELDVHGDIRLGSAGQLFAPGGEENLRIIRGTIEINGGVVSIKAGSGFAVARAASSRYNITFSSAFSGVPTITTSGQVPDPYSSTSNVRSVTPTGAALSLGSEYPQSFIHFIAVGPR